MTTVKNATPPKVSIGIPTYNRADLLRRSIESALGQDYPDIEVLISDNASTDTTPDICLFYSTTCGSRVKYVRQPANIGATANFSKVLEMASGEFFMWLGDDDWIDASYVTSCMKELLGDTSLALASGWPRYYRSGILAFEGKRLDLLQNSWWLRVLIYYITVSDNGIFYGLMHTAQIRRMNVLNTLGGDWLMVAGLSSLGKLKTIPGTHIHRELGGATTSYSRIARSLGLSKNQTSIQVLFPMTSVAAKAWTDIVMKGVAYRSRPVPERLALGSAVFCLILLKRLIGYGRKMAILIIKKLCP